MKHHPIHNDRSAALCNCIDCQRLDLDFPGEGRQLALLANPPPSSRGRDQRVARIS